MDTSNFEKFDCEAYMKFVNPAIIHRDLETLAGIIKGIIGDHLVNVKEHAGLMEWINGIKPYEDRQPYKEVINLLREAIADNILTEEEGNNIIWFCNQYTRKNKYYDDLTAGVQRLHGIVKGIAIDGEISKDELTFLDNWLEDNEHLKNTWPYDELYNITTNILRDQIITPDEHKEILSFCNALSAGKNEATNAESLASLSGGFYQVDPNIVFQEKSFCITGVSKKFKRKEIADRIELHGGFVQNNISSKLNYLIVCDEKNSCWAFSCYGRKIEEAMSYRKKGVQLVIVHEFDLYDSFID